VPITKVVPNVIIYLQICFHMFLTQLAIFPAYFLFYVYGKEIKENIKKNLCSGPDTPARPDLLTDPDPLATAVHQSATPSLPCGPQSGSVRPQSTLPVVLHHWQPPHRDSAILALDRWSPATPPRRPLAHAFWRQDGQSRAGPAPATTAPPVGRCRGIAVSPARTKGIRTRTASECAVFKAPARLRHSRAPLAAHRGVAQALCAGRPDRPCRSAPCRKPLNGPPRCPKPALADPICLLVSQRRRSPVFSGCGSPSTARLTGRHSLCIGPEEPPAHRSTAVPCRTAAGLPPSVS
jgi:hypothetical protein